LVKNTGGFGHVSHPRNQQTRGKGQDYGADPGLEVWKPERVTVFHETDETMGKENGPSLGCPFFDEIFVPKHQYFGITSKFFWAY
jgi:hypothetical protein